MELRLDAVKKYTKVSKFSRIFKGLMLDLPPFVGKKALLMLILLVFNSISPHGNF
jgi:hypothetical protein